MLIPPLLICLIKTFFILFLFFWTQLYKKFLIFKVMTSCIYVFCTENSIIINAKNFIIVIEPRSVTYFFNFFNHVFRIDLIFSAPSIDWLRITVELRLPASATRRLILGGRPPRSCTPSFGLGTTEPGSISSGLTPGLREDWSLKWALETPCHARIATSPQDTTGHVSGPSKPN